MNALDRYNSIEGCGAVTEQGQHTIAQFFDDTTSMGLNHLGNPAGHFSNGLSRPRIAQGFKNACAAEEIGKYDCTVNAHSLLIPFLELGSQFRALVDHLKLSMRY
jgi:hypothetical protein